MNKVLKYIILIIGLCLIFYQLNKAKEVKENITLKDDNVNTRTGYIINSIEDEFPAKALKFDTSFITTAY